MKKILMLSVILCLFLTGFLKAADDVNIFMGLGPYFSLKGGVNTVDTPSGLKNGAAFNGIPDFGATLHVPFSRTSKIGLNIDLGYTTYAYGIVDYYNTSNKATYKFSYLTLAPKFNFSGLLIGFTFGIPVSASGDGNTIRTGLINTLVDFNLGGQIPLFVDKSGSLNLLINASYMLTEVSNTPKSEVYAKFAGKFLNNNFHERGVGASLGLNYLFNIEKK